jgi:hypothetical protein
VTGPENLQFLPAILQSVGRSEWRSNYESFAV